MSLNFRCEYCGQVGKHDFRCPNYQSKIRNKYFCCECGEPIDIGDVFLRNDDGEYMHRECVPGINWLAHWLGYNFETMEEYDNDE